RGQPGARGAPQRARPGDRGARPRRTVRGHLVPLARGPYRQAAVRPRGGWLRVPARPAGVRVRGGSRAAHPHPPPHRAVPRRDRAEPPGAVGPAPCRRAARGEGPVSARPPRCPARIAPLAEEMGLVIPKEREQLLVEGVGRDDGIIDPDYAATVAADTPGPSS